VAAPRASATVTFGDERSDVAVPTGTTVAGLLAMLHIDTSDGELAVTRSDGRPAEPGAVIGADLPSGSVLAVTGSRASARALAVAAMVASEGRSLRAPAVAAAFLLAGLLDVGLLAPLLLGIDPMGLPARVGEAVFALASAVALGLRSDVRDTAIGATLLPLLLGLPFVALLDPKMPTAATLGLAVALWVSLLAGFVLWLAGRRPRAAAAAAVIGAVTLVCSVAMLFGFGAPLVAPLLLALAVLAVVIVPDFSLPVPESQLLDLPLLATAAAAVRTMDVAPPGRITRRRVAFTTDYAQAITDTVTVAGTLTAVGASILTVPLTTPLDATGWGAVATLVCAVGGLGLVARGNRSPLVRVAPRFGAAAITATCAVVGVLGGFLDPIGASGILVLIALLVVFVGVTSASDRRSALVGRLADMAQGLTLVLILPAAIVASGLFDVIRQVVS
jgi:hypothetical protein